MADEKEWDPNEPDPVELQKRQLELGQKFLDKLEKSEADEAERRAKMAEQPPVAAYEYKKPDPAEVSEVFKKAWEETKRIVPDAPERIQLHTFQALVSAFAPPPSFLG